MWICTLHFNLLGKLAWPIRPLTFLWWFVVYFCNPSMMACYLGHWEKVFLLSFCLFSSRSNFILWCAICNLQINVCHFLCYDIWQNVSYLMWNANQFWLYVSCDADVFYMWRLHELLWIFDFKKPLSVSAVIGGCFDRVQLRHYVVQFTLFPYFTDGIVFYP